MDKNLLIEKIREKEIIPLRWPGLGTFENPG